MPEHKLRVFLDTNIIFSGMYSAEKAPGIILDKFVRGDISVVICRQVLDEVVRTVKLKLPEAVPFLTGFLVNSQLEIVVDPEPEDLKNWSRFLSRADAIILAAAINAEPDYFITGDNHFLKNPALKDIENLKIVSPAGFIEVME